MSGKWYEVGVVCRKKDSRDVYIRLDKDVKMILKGKTFKGEEFEVEVDPGGFLNLETPASGFQRMVDHGIMTEEEAEKKASRYEEGGDLSFIRYKIKVGPKK